MYTCTHRATCCRCVCDLTGFVRERGDSVDAEFARPVSVAEAVRHRVPPRDLVHVTDGGDRTLAQSWQNIDIRTLHGEFGFFVVGESTAATDDDGVVHCSRVGATTLSAECQQPCQPNPIRVAGTTESVAQQRFSRHRQASGGNLLDLASLGSLGSRPGAHQLCAKGPTRRSHQRPRRRSERKGLSSTLQPAIDQPGEPNSDSLTGRPLRTLSPECQQPSHQSVKNPPTAGCATNGDGLRRVLGLLSDAVRMGSVRRVRRVAG